MLTYYPEVARVGNLASALSQAFAEAGSSLMAYSSVPPEKPKWSSFSEHPDARGMTVPEEARVRVGDRTCHVWIGFGLVPLGVYRLDFCWASPDDDLVDLEGWINAEDLLSSAQMIIGAYEHDQTLEDVAREFAATFGLRPTPKEDPATTMRLVDRILRQFDEPIRGELRRFVERSAERRSRGEEPDPRDIERLTELIAESRKPRDQ